MKSLKNILIVMKICRVICLILFILAIIGATGVVIGMATMPLVKDLPVPGKDLTVEQYLFEEHGITFPALYYAMGLGLIGSGVSIYLTKHLELYFKKIIAAGTPFSHECVKDTRHCALVHAIFSASELVLCVIFSIIMCAIFKECSQIKGNNLGWGSGIMVSLLLLIFSFFFEYPVELSEKLEPKEENNTEIEPEDYQE